VPETYLAGGKRGRRGGLGLFGRVKDLLFLGGGDKETARWGSGIEDERQKLIKAERVFWGKGGIIWRRRS